MLMPPILSGGAAGRGGATNGGTAGAGGEGGAPVPIHAGCESGDTDEFYVLSEARDLYRLDLKSLTLSQPVTVTPLDANSLALNPDGTLYLATASGDLFTVDPATGQTTSTAFDPSAWGLYTSLAVGAGEVASDGGAGNLYLTRDADANGANNELYVLDLASFTRTLLATFGNYRNPEVTSGDNGRLFGLEFVNSDAQIVEYDTSTFALSDKLPLPIGSNEYWSGWDIAYMAGKLYAFGGAGADQAHIWRASSATALSSQPAVILGTLPINVIGAGARECP